MDHATRRLFMACDTEMVVVNADNGGVVARVRVPSRADENAFDPGTKLAFNANRADSTMTVVHEDTPDKFSVVDEVRGRRRILSDEGSLVLKGQRRRMGATPTTPRT